MLGVSLKLIPLDQDMLPTRERLTLTTTHISDHDLEQYYLGSVLAPEGEAIEQHLTNCNVCLERMADVECFVGFVQSGVLRAGFAEEI